MAAIIRKEEEKDYFAVEEMIREAFWDVYKPGCNEHLIAHQLRKSEGFIKELNYVAEEDGKIIGQIMCTKIQLAMSDDKMQEGLICIGPIGVLPEYQKKGIGSLLMKRVIEEARKMAFKGIILYGDPKYYHRFGFVNAEKYQITTPDGSNFEPFMALELSKGSLKGMQGRALEDQAFATEQEDLAAFEKQFALKESHYKK